MPATTISRACSSGLNSIAFAATQLMSGCAEIIMAGGGDFYAQRPLSAVGFDPAKGVLRVSFVHYTEKAEVDALLGALDQVL